MLPRLGHRWGHHSWAATTQELAFSKPLCLHPYGGVNHMVSVTGLRGGLKQRSSTFLAPDTSFMGDIFLHGVFGGNCSGSNTSGERWQMSCARLPAANLPLCLFADCLGLGEFLAEMKQQRRSIRH